MRRGLRGVRRGVRGGGRCVLRRTTLVELTNGDHPQHAYIPQIGRVVDSAAAVPDTIYRLWLGRMLNPFKVGQALLRLSLSLSLLDSESLSL